MKLIVSKHARERIRQRFNLKVPVQTLANDAWERGRIPNFGAMKYLFWKWATSENDLCDVRKYKGFFFFFYRDKDAMVLKTLYRDTGPKKKAEPEKPISKQDAFKSNQRKYLESVGLLKK